MNAGQRLDGNRLDAALKNLTRRIEAGEEFPDACWASACNYMVSYEALADAYDDAERERSNG